MSRRHRPHRPTRKILCMVALLTCVLGGGVIATGSVGDPMRKPVKPTEIRDASISQIGRSLVVEIETHRPTSLSRLVRLPAAEPGAERFLCLAMRPQGRERERRICLGGRVRPTHAAALEIIGPAGRIVRWLPLSIRVKRPSPRQLVVKLDPSEAGVVPGRYGWRVLSNLRGCEDCAESLPPRTPRNFRMRPVRAVGCTGGTTGFVTHGPRGRKLVALTFDDGPSTLTERFLDVLREKRARGTFFVVGEMIPGREASLRRMLREGHEIANHSTHHSLLPGYADLAETSARIRNATHFTPCIFRPPGGARNGAVLAAAGQAGMKTVNWDVDTADWTRPGSAAIAQRVIDRTRPGSIVLMHDGGGDRAGTLAAVPKIVTTLRKRGYEFVTVTELLRQEFAYRPYG